MDNNENFQKFQVNRELLDTIMENATVSITLMDYEGHFIFFNKQTERNLGIPAGLLRTKTLTELFPKEGSENIELIRKVFEEKKPVQCNVVYTIEGKERHFEMNRLPMFDSEGTVTSVLSIAREITDLVNSQKIARIQRSIDSLQSIGETFEESLGLLFDNLFRLDWINAGGLYLVNYEEEVLELVYQRGLSVHFIESVTSYPLSDPHALVAFNKEPRYASFENFFSDSSANLVSEKITFIATLPLIYREKVLGLLNLASRHVSNIDEADRQEIELIALKVANLLELIKTREELDNSNIELTKKLKELNVKQQMLIQKSRLESLGELSAGLAHEINQPLSIISLAMENINYKLAQQNASEEYLSRKFQTITQNIDKIRQLIDHVRIFSRDQGTIMYERINVNDVISSALSMIGSQLRYHHVEIKKELSEVPGYTIGNPSRLEQVFVNLISNARDAVEEKSKQPGTEGYRMEIRIATSVESDKIVVRVHDNGIGITRDDLSRIFLPFFTTKSAKHGTGLGLPIVYGIIREMKGEIKARSEIGVFTEVSIFLPLYKNIV